MSLQILEKNIIDVECDAIVNITNKQMLPNSGLDLYIHTLAGEELDEECKKLAPLEIGSAKLTKGYCFNSKYIIHTAIPVWKGGEFQEKNLLQSCYLKSLEIAKEANCDSIVIPLLGVGEYGYPKDKILKYAIEVVSKFLFENEMMVYLCIQDKSLYEFDKDLENNINNFIKKSFEKDTDTNENYLYRDICGKSTLCHYGVPEFNSGKTLDDYINQRGKNFLEMLVEYIDKKGMTDVECYKKANIDRKTFSKIRTNPNQKPTKQTAVSFAIALELTFEETQDLLKTIGLTLSSSQTFDLIIKYFLSEKIYDIHKINYALFQYDQVLLGSKN